MIVLLPRVVPGWERGSWSSCLCHSHTGQEVFTGIYKAREEMLSVIATGWEFLHLGDTHEDHIAIPYTGMETLPTQPDTPTKTMIRNSDDRTNNTTRSNRISSGYSILEGSRTYCGRYKKQVAERGSGTASGRGGVEIPPQRIQANPRSLSRLGHSHLS